MVRNSPKLITNQLLYQLSYIGSITYRVVNSTGASAIRKGAAQVCQRVAAL